MKTETIKDFLTTLSDSIENDNQELYKKIIDSSEIKSFNNPDEFFYAVLYPWKKFISGFLKSSLNANKDVEFIFTNSQYLDRHFATLFIQYEGTAYSSDKSGHIVNQLLKYYATGERIEFDYDGKYTYHLPDKIFKNHEQIVKFYEGLKSLLYGNPMKYLEALKECCR